MVRKKIITMTNGSGIPMLRRLILSLSIVVLVAGFLWPRSVFAHPQMIQISVGQNGYDQVVDYTISVEAGHEVTLTFTYADEDLSADNPHEIRIKGPGIDDLPTVRVSKDHSTATLTFTPTKNGTLHILCILPCIGMENLVGGQVKVQKPRATGAQTSLALDLSPREDGSTLARAKLLTADGKPISGVPVTFSLRTSLGGDLELSSPTSMEDGSAVVKIPPMSTGAVKVMAQFEGGNGLAYSEATPVLVLILLVVLGGV